MKCLEVWPDNFYRCFINNHKSKALSENRALCRITRQHQQSGHFTWPLRLRRDDTPGHLSSAQHTGDVPIMTIASSPRSPLFSFIPEAFEKFSHLYKKKKRVFENHQANCSHCTNQKKKTQRLAEVHDYIFGLGNFPPFLNCLFAKQHHRHIVPAGKVSSWVHCTISKLDLRHLSSTFHCSVCSCSSRM